MDGGAHVFLQNLALVLCVAAVTTVVFQRLKLPVVLGYLLAGMLVGPHLPIPLFADTEMIQTLSELGVILLLFSLGLEFRLRKLVEVGPRVAIIALVEISLMISLGFAVGRLLGWPARASLFVGAVVAVSSTTIITKVFDEQRVTGKLRDVVYGVLVFEDLVAILLLAALAAMSSGRALSTGTVAETTMRLGAFLVALLAVGMLVVPRLFRAIVRLGRPETTLVASIGLCFAMALLAQAIGYSVALGAFLAGALIAESGEERVIAPLVRPVRDMFGAIFFIAAGMSIDLVALAEHWPAAVAVAFVVLAGKIFTVSLSTFLVGFGVQTAVQAGMSLAQIGELSFVFAAMAVSAGETDPFFYPVAVAVSALTTLSTPFLVKRAPRTAALLGRTLPQRLQTFISLYESWVDAVRKVPSRPTAAARVRRLVRLLFLDAAVLAGIVVGTALSLNSVSARLSSALEWREEVSRALIIGLALAAAGPFAVGIVRVARRLGATLAEVALPSVGVGAVDLAAAPRRTMVVTLQLASVLLVGAPLVAVTQPFLPPFRGALALLALLAVLGFAFWRSASDLQGHVQAGAQMIVEVLAAQSRTRPEAHQQPSLDLVHSLLPGLGTPAPFRLEAGNGAIGKTLAQLNLRGVTGATVLAITRGETGVLPIPDQLLHEGDVLALAGSSDAIRTAIDFLQSPPPNPHS